MSQKRKNQLKAVGAGLLCLGIAGAFTRVPDFARDLYISLFNTINIPAFMLVMGLLICEIFFLRQRKYAKNHIYICMITAFVVSLFMLFHGHASLYEKLMPGQDLTLISMTVREQNDGKEGEDTLLQVWDSGLGKLSFLQNYFGDRNLIRADSVDESEIDRYVITCVVPPSQMFTGEEITVTDEMTDKILSYPFWHNDSYDYVVDEYWEDSSAIRMIKREKGYIFCSQELIEACQDNPAFTSEQYEASSRMSYEQKCSLAISLVRDAAEGVPYRNIKQIIIMIAFLLLGLIITLPLWGAEYPALAFFMGFPMGVAFWCIYSMLLMILHIPYNPYTIGIGMVFLMGIWVYRQREKYRELDWTCLFHFSLASLCVITLFVYARICSVSMDTYSKTAMGYRLAKFGSLREVLSGAAPFGMLEPIVTSVGFLFGCDFIYAFYPLTGISGLGIMFAGIYYLYQKNGKSDESMLAFCMGILLLLSNYDFLLSIFCGLAHGPTSVYTLIVVVFITLKRQLDLPDFSCAVIMASAIITLARVEGAVYTLFILAASLGLQDERLKMKKIIVSEALIVAVWNVYQWIYVGRSGGEIFWTPEKGMILVGGSIAVVLAAVAFDKQWAVINFIKRRYLFLLMAGIVGGAVISSVLLKAEMASINFPVYLSHFSNSAENDTNSSALWIFLLLMCPVLLSMRNQIAAYSVTLVGGYLVLIYFICLFRGELPLRLGYSDSARRTIVHIMSTAVWLLASSIASGVSCDKKKEVRVCDVRCEVSKKNGRH